MTLWIYVVVVLAGIVIVMTGYVLLLSSGDGRRPLERLKHPTEVGPQEEYGGDGKGHRKSVFGMRRPPSRQ